MQLSIITPEHNIADEEAWVNALFHAGLSRLHLRKPHADEKALMAYLQRIDPSFRNKVILHSHFNLMRTEKAGGVHLNAATRDSVVGSELQQQYSGMLSTSFHSWAELENNDFPYQFVFISPVFDSISKQGYKAAIPLESLQSAKSTALAGLDYCPLVFGLGGVSAANVRLLRDNGFDGAALLGSIWTAADPVAAFNEVVNAIDTNN